MLTKFSTSTNIVRDRNVDLNYIVTPNAKNIANQIVSDFQIGLHSFSVIGSYGTGKSSFLWALEKNLLDRKDFFFKLNGQFGSKADFELINIVGSFTSFNELLRNEIGCEDSSSTSVLNGLEKKYLQLHNEGKTLLIVVDEFGKLLEFAAANNPEDSMYFIQQLAEFCNDNSRNILLITTLHQNFGAYANQLTNNQKQEWIKVKGRFKELSFNEPIEQLLFLASSRIKTWNTDNSKNSTAYKNAYDLAKNNYLLSHGLRDNSDVAEEMYPLEILASIILTKALQRYGQNERSLFTFLNDRNSDSLFEHFRKGKIFTLIEVFDYLYSNFFSFLITSLNEDKNNWDALRNALSRAKSVFKNDYETGEIIIKIIGLLNILGEPGGHITREFIIKYAEFIGINSKNISDGIDILKNKKIIYYRDFASRFVLTEGTDLDYEAEISKAALSINPNFEIVTAVKEYFNQNLENPRRISFKTGTSRFFQYMLTQYPITSVPSEEIDGYINLVFNDKMEKSVIKDASNECKEAILYVFFPNISSVKETIINIEKIRVVIRENEHDKVAVKELKIREGIEKRKLNTILNDAIFEIKSGSCWFFKGDELKITSKKDLNKELSIIVEKVYKHTPILKNELFNKHKYSSQISTARKQYIKHLLDNSNEELLGFPIDKYPPEKTIYLSLLQETGIHSLNESGKLDFSRPLNNSFNVLWDQGIEFLNDAKFQRLSINEYIKILSNRPLKLKQGFIDFWVPTFLIINRHDYALFNENIYVPYLSVDLFDLIWKSPEKFFIKSYNVEGIRLDIFNKYRELINMKSEAQIDQKVFIDTIRPFIIFFRELPFYSKNTMNITAAAISLREAIAASPDPETAFFIEFPMALGFNPSDIEKPGFNIDDYVNKLQDAIRELRSSYDELLSRFEKQLLKIAGIKSISYKEFKKEIIDRFETLEIESLASTPKKLLGRIRAPYDKRNDFYNSLSFALIGKSLKELNDNDEPILIKSFSKQFYSLERLVPIHELNKKRVSESVYGLDITNPDGGKVITNILINAKLEQEFTIIKAKFEETLKPFKKEDKLKLLFKMLKEEMEDDS